MDFGAYVESEDALFHYTKLSTAIEHILHTNRFKPSILNYTNDPQEYKMKIRSSFGSFIAEKAPNDQMYGQLHLKANNRINRMSRFESKVMCFCSNTKPILLLRNGTHLEDKHARSNGWNKSRMWAQYGQDHYGVCLVFSKEELGKILREIQDQNKIYYKADYVKYIQEDTTAWKEIDISSIQKEGVESYSLSYIKENSEELFFQKQIDYRDESEYRVVVIDPENRIEYINIETSTKGLIVGDRTAKAYVPLIVQICKKFDIESKRAHWSISHPHMVLTPIE